MTLEMNKGDNMKSKRKQSFKEIEAFEAMDESGIIEQWYLEYTTGYNSEELYDENTGFIDTPYEQGCYDRTKELGFKSFEEFTYYISEGLK